MESFHLKPTQAFFKKCEKGYAWGEGIRYCHVIHFCKSGKGLLKIRDKTYHIKAGQCFYFPPLEPVFYQADEEDPWEYEWFDFQGSSVHEILSHSTLSAENPVLSEIPETISGLFDSACRKEFGVGDFSEQLDLCGKLMTLLSRIVKYYPAENQKDPGKFKIADRIHALIEENFRRSWFDITAMGKILNVSRPTLHRIFASEFHTTPGLYLKNYRLDRAAEILEHTKISVKATAFSVGFGDPLYFSAAFKKKFGVSPSFFRTNRGAAQQCSGESKNGKEKEDLAETFHTVFYREYPEESRVHAIDVFLHFYPEGRTSAYEIYSTSSPLLRAVSLDVEGGYASRETTGGQTREYILACQKVDGIPEGTPWEAYFDHPEYYGKYDNILYKGKRYIAMSGRYGSGGPAYHYQEASDGSVTLSEALWTDEIPSKLWSWIGEFTLQEIRFHSNHTQVTATIVFENGYSAPLSLERE